MKTGHIHLHSHKIGQLHFGTKAHLLEPLEQLAESNIEAPQVTSVFLDGAAIVQMLKPGYSKTFHYNRICHRGIYSIYILSQIQHQSRLDLIWGQYAKSDSLKATVRSPMHSLDQYSFSFCRTWKENGMGSLECFPRGNRCIRVSSIYTKSVLFMFYVYH